MTGTRTRRDALRLIAAGTAVALSPAAANVADAAGKTHWSYQGADGPANWGRLDQEFATCSTGTQQSPVDLHASIPAELNAVQVHWRPVPLEVINNGHTIQVNCPPGGFVVLEGRRFDLLQFHFHHPSEHHLVGQAFPLEVHFVHRSQDGDLAVLGVFFAEGAANSQLKPIWDNAPTAGGTARLNIWLDIADMLPHDRAYFRYAGSLTTPPCSETVNWVVFASPIQASSEQIATFARVFPNNARPVQALHRRFILGTF